MADGFIVRKGGAVTEQALAPTITEVSTTADSITFTLTNNDASTAVILYEVDDATPDENSVELAAAATSSNITITGLTEDVEYDVYATANVTGKVKSNVTELAITTVAPIVYTAATGGTTEEYDSGGARFKSHTFTSSGTFTVTTVGDATDDRDKVDYLIIAGGGSGGTGDANVRPGGGGGAGGFRTTSGTQGGLGTLDSKVTVTVTSYGVTIGGGGAARSGSNLAGNSGANSSVAFSSTITSDGGGGGGGRFAQAISGGSGGGGRSNPGGSISSGTANQGFAGGDGGQSDDFPDRNFNAGGGGGAGQLGGDVFGTEEITNGAGDGGNGLANTLRDGTSETRAGGGGGGGQSNSQAGTGGTGGGGDGHITGTSVAGTVNTGSGGGGGTNSIASGAGGAGLVVIRYEIAPSV